MASQILRPVSDLSVTADTWTKTGASFYGSINDAVESPDAVSDGEYIQLPFSESGEVTLELATGLPENAVVESVQVFLFIVAEESASGSSLNLHVNGGAIIDDEVMYETSGAGSVSEWVSSTDTPSSQIPTSLTLTGSTSAGAYIRVMAAYAKVTYSVAGLANRPLTLSLSGKMRI